MVRTSRTRFFCAPEPLADQKSATESDSDSEVESFTNRGHKLQKRARFAHKGQLAPTAGPSAYKEV